MGLIPARRFWADLGCMLLQVNRSLSLLKQFRIKLATDLSPLYKIYNDNFLNLYSEHMYKFEHICLYHLGPKSVVVVVKIR